MREEKERAMETKKKTREGWKGGRGNMQRRNHLSKKRRNTAREEGREGWSERAREKTERERERASEREREAERHGAGCHFRVI